MFTRMKRGDFIRERAWQNWSYSRECSIWCNEIDWREDWERWKRIRLLMLAHKWRTPVFRIDILKINRIISTLMSIALPKGASRTELAKEIWPHTPTCPSPKGNRFYVVYCGFHTTSAVTSACGSSFISLEVGAWVSANATIPSISSGTGWLLARLYTLKSW